MDEEELERKIQSIRDAQARNEARFARMGEGPGESRGFAIEEVERSVSRLEKRVDRWNQGPGGPNGKP